MSRSPLEMADIVRSAGQTFIDRSRRWLNWQHEKVLLAITRCRTAALGGHRDQCSHCGHSVISYNSCRNRHCPKCQGNARHRWLEARQRELLPTRYVHVVFTLPGELAPLALQNKKLIYDLLFRTSAATLLEVARDPRHLGAEIGFFSVLHTWNQKLQLHPHVHCVLPAGGLSPDHTHWIHTRHSFFLPIKVLSRVFRGKFVAGLKRACSAGKLRCYGDLERLAQPKIFSAWLRQLFRHDWVVYCKPPFGGPEHALRYLGAYTLPRGFVRALLLPLCAHLLHSVQESNPDNPPAPRPMPALTSWICPICGGAMHVIERFSAAQIQLRAPPPLCEYAA